MWNLTTPARRGVDQMIDKRIYARINGGYDATSGNLALTVEVSGLGVTGSQSSEFSDFALMSDMNLMSLAEGGAGFYAEQKRIHNHRNRMHRRVVESASSTLKPLMRVETIQN
jgi:hypothetical protein